MSKCQMIQLVVSWLSYDMWLFYLGKKGLFSLPDPPSPTQS